MKQNARVPKGTKVVVTHPSLKSFGQVFTVVDDGWNENSHKYKLRLEGNGKFIYVLKENLEFYVEALKPVSPSNSVEVKAVEPVYCVANKFGNLSKERFNSIEVAETFIKTKASEENSGKNSPYSVLQVLKTYKASVEIKLEEV